MSTGKPDEAPAILQIVPALDAGGAERTTVDIARAIGDAGYRPLVISEGGRLQRELLNAGGELITMRVASKSPFRILANASAIAKLIRQRNVVLVHARSRGPAWSALLAARRTGIPFVTTYHGIYNAKGRMKRWYNSVMARGDAVIANSEWTARHILSTYRFQPKRLTVIPRGMDLEWFKPESVELERIFELRDLWTVKDEELVLLLPGRLTRWKGQLVLVRALALLRREGRLPNGLRAVIAGSTQGRKAYFREIMNMIATEGLTDVAVVSNHIADMPAAYLAADIVVSASTDPEAFGRVPPEAAAMGKPVIATDHGGARETVLPGESGLLVRPGSVSALAEAILDLASRPQGELAAMGAKGRAHIAALFTVERMRADTLALYGQLLDKQRARVLPPLERETNRS